jgi:hypothetical protein
LSAASLQRLHQSGGRYSLATHAVALDLKVKFRRETAMVMGGPYCNRSLSSPYETKVPIPVVSAPVHHSQELRSRRLLGRLKERAKERALSGYGGFGIDPQPFATKCRPPYERRGKREP